MILCVCRSISEDEARETCKKIHTYFPLLTPEKKYEIFTTAYGQPRCGLCRDMILEILNEEQ
jgi:bacterioferritin-associated ferredoxin